MLDLLTVGDIKLDAFIVIPEASVACDLKMPECKLCIAYGKKIPVEGVISQIAGTAPNVAVGVAKMGRKTAVYAVLGDDATAVHAAAFLKANKVGTSYLVKQPGMRSSSAAVLLYKGEATQLVDHIDVEYRLPDPLPATQWLHLSELGNGYERLYRDVIAAQKRGVLVSINPGTVQLHDRKSDLLALLRVTEVLFLNMVEARKLLRIDNGDGIHAITSGLAALGPHYVVITDGAHGAYAYDGRQLDRIGAFPAAFREATGAGDAFSSAFLGAIMRGKHHREALKYAAVNAASVVEHVGPTKGLLTFAEITKRLASRPSFATKEL